MQNPSYYSRVSRQKEIGFLFTKSVFGNDSEVAKFKEFREKKMIIPAKHFQYFKLLDLLDILFFNINLFIYLFIYWLCWVFVAAHGLSLVVASRGYSVAVRGLLIAVASLVADHGL